MKKIALSIMLILVLMLIPTIIFAMEPVTPENVVKEYVAEIVGGEKYTSLADAIEDVPTTGVETTINILKNVENGTGFVTKDGQNIIIDFKGFSYDACNPTVGSKDTETNGCQLRKGSTVTLKNGTFLSTKGLILIQNYSDLTLHNMHIQPTIAKYALSCNNGNINITGNTSIKAIEGGVAFDVYWWPENGTYKNGAQITIDTTGTIEGKIELASSKQGLIDDVKSTLIIKNMNHVGTFDVIDARVAEKVTIKGGTFSSDVSNYIASGFACEKVGDIYKVGMKFPVNTNTIVGGKVQVDKNSVFDGETVKITVTPDEGYKVGSILVKDENEKEITITNNSFVMPSSQATVHVEFNKIPEKITQEIDVPAEVEETEELEANLLDSLQEAIKTNSELAKIVNNNNVEVKLEFNELEEKEVEDAEKEEIEEAVAKEVKGIKIVKYLDITIVVKNKDKNGELVDNLEELNEEITFTVTIPTDLPVVEKGYTRNYYIIRNHNGEIEIIKNSKLSEDGKSIIFGSDKFSTYAIGYNDVENSGAGEAVPGNKEEESTKPTGTTNTESASIGPVTGDDIAIYVVSLMISLVGIVALSVLNKSKNRH